MEKKILVSCSAFLENEKKQFLFLKRSENSSWGKNQWQLPEGKMEWGETPEQTIKREVFEEISCKIKEIEYIGFQTVNIKTPNTDYHVLSLIFKAKIDNKEIKLSDEHNAF
ncbi:MAG: NUDIX domain-containing protein, partial [archaeon]|nr:NUDIX domain-containing protein [archaeon]